MASAERQVALRSATATLRASGNPTPRVDAELLLAHVLGIGRAHLALSDVLPADAGAAYDDLVLRRAKGVPLQHLTGRAPFRHLDLAVGPGVFIPRPETELIIDLAATYLADAETVVDLCAGSGAIALSVAMEYPGRWVIAVERSSSALDWLRRNAAGTNVEIVQADITEDGLVATLAGKVDVVLSNPPYVPEAARTDVGREVDHDPDDAVFAGPDGLGLMPALIATAARLLRPGGFFAVEHDETHGESVPALLRASGDWTSVADHVDLTGRPRFASATRR